MSFAKWRPLCLGLNSLMGVVKCFYKSKPCHRVQQFCVPSAYWFSMNDLFIFTMSLCFPSSSYIYRFYFVYSCQMDDILNGRYSAQRYWLPVVAVKPINCMIQRNVAILIFLSYSLKYALDLSLSDKYWFAILCIMMTSSNGNIFRVTGLLCGEFTGARWILRTKVSNEELWCFFDLHLNKQLSKQSRGWWFEAPSGSLWRQCNDITATPPEEASLRLSGKKRWRCMNVMTSQITFNSIVFSKVCSG